MDYKVIATGSHSELTRQVKEHISEGWKPVGSHQVVTRHAQNRFAGLQHRDTQFDLEYSQTMIKENENT